MAWFWSGAAAAKPPGGGAGTLTTSSTRTPPSSRQRQQIGGGGNHMTARADWFWSTSPTPASVPADQRRGTSSPTASAAPTTTRLPPPPTLPQQPAVVDPASHVDPEITKFLNYFKEDMALLSAATTAPAAPASHGHPSSRASLTGPSTSASASSSSSSSSAAMTAWSPPQSQSQSQSQSPPPDIPHSLYPTTMSCSQAFDLARRCQSIPGQLRHVYRYGNFRSCSEHWSDFWFCMRHVGAPSGPVKESLIREHYREKEHRKYYAEGCRSSEAVWSSREEKVPPETFFVEPYDPPVESDDEWRRGEIERRRNIREALDGVGA